jgi:hypothetical protein
VYSVPNVGRARDEGLRTPGRDRQEGRVSEATFSAWFCGQVLRIFSLEFGVWLQNPDSGFRT